MSAVADSTRLAFEAWALSSEWAVKEMLERNGDDYRNQPTQEWWDVWRAARAPWIPVSVRLPAIGEPVWIAAWAWDNPGGTRIYGVAVYDGKAWGNPQDPEQSATWWPPTHWMPLPAAPAFEAPATADAA